MKLPLHVAKKLQELKSEGSISSSSLNRDFISLFMSDGLLTKESLGRSRSKLHLKNPNDLSTYLKNRYGIPNLEKYIAAFENETLEGTDAIALASNSKIRQIRTFKGFLLNTYHPIVAELNGKEFNCRPQPGSFIYINEFETFNVPSNVVIVGVENSENFRLIERQKHLFKNIVPLFVSRYPQSGDLIRWLLRISNPYIHFGDFDFAGINIYQSEYKIHLRERASLFIPEDIEKLTKEFGNRELYNKQLQYRDSIIQKADKQTRRLIDIIDSLKKGLEQQVLIA